MKVIVCQSLGDKWSVVLQKDSLENITARTVDAFGPAREYARKLAEFLGAELEIVNPARKLKPLSRSEKVERAKGK